MEVIRLIFSPIQVNSYILAAKTGECAVLDCGCYDKNEFSALLDVIESKNLRPVLLLNTHCHLDHIFGNRFMKEKYGLSPWSAELEEPNRLDAADHAKLFGLSMATPPEPSGFIIDNQIFTFGEISLKALHVPGHTAGSMAFYSEADKCVFTGDALFAGSIGRSDLPGGNYNTLIASIRNRLLTLPGGTTVYSGHGPETTIDREKRTNQFLI